MEMWLVLLSIVLLLLVLASGKVQAHVAFSGLLFVYFLFDLIQAEALFANFVNPALITLILLILVSVVIEKTNWIEALSKRLFVKSLRQSYFRMGLLVGSSSALLNNTAVVATLLSSVKSNAHHAASKLLIPLSYFAILGGTVTLIGTSTNLMVNGLVVQSGLPSLNLLDFVYVGLPLLLLGVLTIVMVGKRVLPDIELEQIETPEYFIEAKIEKGALIDGQTVHSAGLRELGSLFLVQIYRDGELISPVSPHQVIYSDDRLLFSGDIKEAKKIIHIDGLTLAGGSHSKQSDNLVEVILSHTSNLIGRTIKEAGFRNRFDAAVVALQRGQDTLNSRIADVELQAGDKLVLATGADFASRDNVKQNFYFYSKVNTTSYLSSLQSFWVGLSFIVVLLLAIAEVVPLLKGLVMLLAGFFAFKLITLAEVKRRFPYELTIVIASALGIASVMIEVGVASQVANWVLAGFSAWGVMGSLIGVYLLTLLLTELITNNASAAIGLPVALATAEILGVSPWPFIMVVAYGASASFLTPYGYQTNLMVYAAGKYQFMNYVRAGLPLTIVYSFVVIGLVPLFFPF